MNCCRLLLCVCPGGTHSSCNAVCLAGQRRHHSRPGAGPPNSAEASKAAACRCRHIIQCFNLRWTQACGSGGTTAGLALGFHLSGSWLPLSSYGVCDSPEVFYDDIDGLFKGLGQDTSSGVCQEHWERREALPCTISCFHAFNQV